MAEVTQPPRAHRHPVVLGATSIILGILALLMPALVGLAAAMVIGVLLIIGGVMRFGWAMRAGSVGRGALLFALGVLMGLGGLALLFNPLLAAGAITIILGIYFILDGILEIVVGLRVHDITAGWGWLLFAGIVSILLGILIWAQFPLSGIWAIGILVGIKLIFTGIVIIASGAEGPIARAA